MEAERKPKIGILIACLALACVVFDVMVWLRPGWFNHNSEYSWRVLWHGRKLAVVWVFMLWGAIISGALFTWNRFSQKMSGMRQDVLAAAMIFLLGILSPLIFFQAGRFGARELLVRMFVADHTGYFQDAVKFKTRANLDRAYQEDLSTLSTHGRTHPPGDALMFMGLIRCAENSAALQGIYKASTSEDTRKQIDDHFGAGVAEQTAGAMGMMIMLMAGALAAALGYFLLRRFYSADLCLLSGLALVTLPAFSAKAPVMDQVFAVFILGAVLVSLIGERGRIWQGLAAGFLTGTGVWFSSGVWSAALLIPFMMLARELQYEPGRKAREIYESMLGVGFSGMVAAGFMLWLGHFVIQMDYIDIFRTNRMGWFINNAASGRMDAWKWMVFNPYEFFFWTSLPIFFGVVLKFAVELKQSGESFARILKMDLFFIATMVFMVILDFSGQVCYESPRLCWFLLPIIANLGMTGFVGYLQSLHSRIYYALLLLITLSTIINIVIY